MKYEIINRFKRNTLIRYLANAVLLPLRFMDFFKVLEARVVLRYLNIKHNESVLDIACGCGEISIDMFIPHI